MDNCRLTERCGIHLEDMLLSTTTLCHLSLSWNRLAAVGAAHLARGLEANFSVTTLLLRWTGITDLGCCHIAEALKGNSGIVCADLSGNNAGYNCSVVIAEMLSVNETVKVRVLTCLKVTFCYQGMCVLMTSVDSEVSVRIQHQPYCIAVINTYVRSFTSTQHQESICTTRDIQYIVQNGKHQDVCLMHAHTIVLAEKYPSVHHKRLTQSAICMPSRTRQQSVTSAPITAVPSSFTDALLIMCTLLRMFPFFHQLSLWLRRSHQSRLWRCECDLEETVHT